MNIEKIQNRPSIHFNKEEQIVTVYCTPELYQVFIGMTGQEKSNANELFVLLKAIKQIKNILLDNAESQTEK